ncbi:hypothetical protein GVN20_20670 [Runella sp. CRIBMP]|uniref:hypothetical protein n=1 Tax=Runella sp. CRIBMP TaxID=2683261 RepID=UPI0014124B4A|nr:hypothetical protein [Runella sp. CRIBMP]NBB21789.1 hypothetical protein [Runella sp. CRIBMP]
MSDISYYEHDGKQFITGETVKDLQRNNRVVNADRGGFVKGPFHTEGGIMCFRESLDFKGEFEVVAEIEGWEYIINTVGTDRYAKRIGEINAEIDGTLPFEPYDVPKNISTINAEPIIILGNSTSKWIKLSPYKQWIVNRHSTQKYLRWLIGINNETLGMYLKSLTGRR